jgi:hypothetical protein
MTCWTRTRARVVEPDRGPLDRSTDEDSRFDFGQRLLDGRPNWLALTHIRPFREATALSITIMAAVEEDPARQGIVYGS